MARGTLFRNEIHMSLYKRCIASNQCVAYSVKILGYWNFLKNRMKFFKKMSYSWYVAMPSSPGFDDISAYIMYELQLKIKQLKCCFIIGCTRKVTSAFKF